MDIFKSILFKSKKSWGKEKKKKKHLKNRYRLQGTREITTKCNVGSRIQYRIEKKVI